MRVVTDRRRGAIGVDLNADHLAVAETDASGNWLNAWQVPLVTYGKSTHQTEALIGNAVAGVVEYARDVGKPVVIERLDFRPEEGCPGGGVPQVQPDVVELQLRQGQGLFPVPWLPSGSGGTSGQPGFQLGDWPGQVHGTIRAQCSSGGCPGAGPSFNSVAQSTFHAGGLAPVGNGVHVAFTVPARKRVKHVWTYWGAITRQLRPALATQYRLDRQKRRFNPAQADSWVQA